MAGSGRFCVRRGINMWIVCLAGAISLLLHSSAYPANRMQGASAADLLQNRPTLRDVFLVDVRPGASFSRVRIPRSVNIPLFAVKSKTFLRDKDVVIVNDGFQASILEQECQALLAGGMKSVRVLEGGIVSWAAAGGPLEGDAAALQELRMVEPGVFDLEKAQAALFTIVTDISAETARALIPEARHVPFDPGGEDFLARLGATLRDAGVGESSAVLVVDGNGSTYARLQGLFRDKKFQAANPANFYFLAGGLEGYRTHRKRQVALIKGMERVGTGGCPDCPRGRDR